MIFLLIADIDPFAVVPLLCRIVPLLTTRLQVDSNPPPNVVEGGAQVKQMINAECLMEFNDHPLIDLQFR